MFSNRFGFAVLGIACVAAAGVGGYLASRQNAVPAPAAAMSQPANTPAAVTDRPVQETEAVVDTPKKVGANEPPAPASPVSSPKPAGRRTEAPARTTARPVERSARAATTAPPLPPLPGTWPSGAAAPVPAPPAAPPLDDTRVDENAPPEPPAPPTRTFEDLVVSADSVIGLQTESRLSSETARVEDRVEARVTRDVKVGDRIAIPAGTRAIGSVMAVDRGGKFREPARIGIRFHTLVLADGTRLPISTETIYRDSEAPSNRSSAKIGAGAVGGAILGAILGGAKGAVIGGAAGAGAGTAAVEAGGRSEVVLPPGTALTARIVAPVTVTIESNR